MTPEEELEEKKRKEAQEAGTIVPTDQTQANLKAAEDAYVQSQQALAAEQAKINAERNRTFNDIVNDAYNEKMRQQREMKQQEQANTMSSMATGTTELAAGIINMLSVGQLHANNQQYRSYSQDWMRKADQDLRENRHRRDNLNATMQRLKLQQEQVRTAGRIEDMKLKQQQAADALNMARQKEQQEYQRGKDAEDRAFREKQFERQAKQTDASIAQGWARIKQAEDKNTTSMLANGWVPDPSAPGGFRYAPQEVKEKYGFDPSSSSSSSSSGSGSSGTDAIPIIDKNGNVNVAHLRPHEMTAVLSTAQFAIGKELGPVELAEFNRKMRMAGDDKAKNAVLMEYMGKSEAVGEAIREIDKTYQGVHGNDQPQEPENRSGYHNANERKGKSTTDLWGSL